MYLTSEEAEVLRVGAFLREYRARNPITLPVPPAQYAAAFESAQKAVQQLYDAAWVCARDAH